MVHPLPAPDRGPPPGRLPPRQAGLGPHGRPHGDRRGGGRRPPGRHAAREGPGARAGQAGAAGEREVAGTGPPGSGPDRQRPRPPRPEGLLAKGRDELSPEIADHLAASGDEKSLALLGRLAADGYSEATRKQLASARDRLKSGWTSRRTSRRIDDAPARPGRVLRRGPPAGGPGRRAAPGRCVRHGGRTGRIAARGRHRAGPRRGVRGPLPPRRQVRRLAHAGRAVPGNVSR